MNRSFMSEVVIVLFLLSQTGCKPKVDGIKYFEMATSCLKDVRQSWLNSQNPKDFEPNKVIEGTYSNVFLFTNAVEAGGKVYQCRFAVHDNIWPPGLLAVCDDDTVLWIRERDGKVVVDPVHKMIEP